jgi:hypothetical protein
MKIVIIIIGVILFMAIGCVIAYTAGRAKGFEDCWKQYLKDNWDKKEQKV